MSIIGLVGAGASIGGLFSKDVQEFQRQYFNGSFEVTAGDAVSGVYGTQYSAVFGPAVNHVVNFPLAGLLGGIAGGAADFNPVIEVLLGAGGEVDYACGLRSRLLYGGLQFDIVRGDTMSKRGTAPSMWQALTGEVPELPNNLAGIEIAAQDAASLRAVTLLNALLNLTTAITQLVMRFKYPDYHRPRAQADLEDPSKADAYDQMQWYGAPRILDNIVTELPRRIMGVILVVENSGGFENGWAAFKSTAAEILKKIGLVTAILVGIPFVLPLVIVGLVCEGLVRLAKWFAKAAAKFIKENLAMLLVLLVGGALLGGAVAAQKLLVEKK